MSLLVPEVNIFHLKKKLSKEYRWLIHAKQCEWGDQSLGIDRWIDFFVLYCGLFKRHARLKEFNEQAYIIWPYESNRLEKNKDFMNVLNL